MNIPPRHTGPIDKIRGIVIKKTAAHFNFDQTYVRKIVAGDRNNEEVLSYYRKKYEELSRVLNS